MKKLNGIGRAWVLVSLLVLLLAGLDNGSWSAQITMRRLPYWRKLPKRAQKWVNHQLKRMRLEEKIGQMLMVEVPADFVNIESEEFKQLRHHIMENRVGAIMLGEGNVYAAAMLINRLQELARFPLLVACDLEAGAGMRLEGATNIPWNMAVGATRNLTMAEQQGAIIAQEARVTGINVLFAPVADLSRDGQHPMIDVRAYGDDPEQVAQFVGAFVRGAQAYGVMAVVKTFPGYGTATFPADGGFPSLDAPLQQLHNVELRTFAAAAFNRVGAIMVGVIAMPQLDPTPMSRIVSRDSPETAPPGSLPVVFSSKILGLIRKDPHFDGLIFTDSLRSKNVMARFRDAAAAVQAVKAGVDIVLSPPEPDRTMRALWDAVNRGEIKKERIEESVRRILTAKARLGLNQNRFTDIDIFDNFISAGRFQKAARSIAEKAVTLVRNDQHLLPLRLPAGASMVHIAITDADTNERERQAVGRVLHSQLQPTFGQARRIVIDQTTPADRAPQIWSQTQAADLIIVSLFVHPQPGRQGITLPAAGGAVLNRLLQTDRPLIVISFGSPYLLLDYPTIGTYICAFGDARDSTASQKAVADALREKIPFQGKLPVALPGLYPRGQGILMGAPRPRREPGTG